MRVLDLPGRTLQYWGRVRFVRTSANGQRNEGGNVISTEFLQIAEGLNHLDPVRSYPNRAAKLVAGLANATSYRVEFADAGDKEFDSTPPPPPDGTSVALPLRLSEITGLRAWKARREAMA